MIGADLEAAHRSLGRQVFKPVMSHDARTLLECIVGHLNRWMQPGGKNSLLTEFADQYTACLYEDAILGWPFRDVKKKADGLLKKAKDPQQILMIARLVPLFNKTWEINVSQGAQFRFSRSASQTEAYDFLTREFLLDDFSRSDLIKLSEVARKPLDTIKDICRKFDRPEQRSITYLYRVVNNEEKQQEAVAQNTDRVMQNSMGKLKDILMAQQDDKRFQAPLDSSWVEDVKITREMEGTDDYKDGS